MFSIELGRVGYIQQGEDAGKYVLINELDDRPPSYLILLAHDKGFNEGCGDCWVEDYLSLGQFFTEAGWVVDWDL